MSSTQNPSGYKDGSTDRPQPRPWLHPSRVMQLSARLSLFPYKIYLVTAAAQIA